MPLNQRDCASLLDALARAIREVSPLAARADLEAIAGELEARVRNYWGENHGISREEMIATARDVITSAVPDRND